MCPLFFRNSRIGQIRLIGLTSSFYKHNVLAFTNDTYSLTQLDSDVRILNLNHVENIVLDSTLLNPSVFSRLEQISVFGSVQSIESRIFSQLKHLWFVRLDADYFRKLANKQGIDWLRSINPILNVNLSDELDLSRHNESFFRIYVEFFSSTKVASVFPDHDFCVYRDFPFQQLVVLSQYLRSNIIQVIIYNKPSCLYEWLTQYYETLSKHDKTYLHTHLRLKRAIESAYPQNCSFPKLIDNCKRNTFKAKHLWDINDAKTFGKYLQVVLTISSHAISILGIFTNSIMIYIIVSRNNEDIFKNFKLYPYLCAMSAYNILILSIQLISWLSECKYIYDVFCPSTRRFVAVQFFKIIFKEALVVALRFMSNFAYFAFAFNRVALIGKDHLRFVAWLAEVRVKRYLFFIGFISFGLSVVKGFKYKVRLDFFFSICLDYFINVKF